LYVSVVILVSFVLFSANGLTGAAADIGAMFGFGNLPLWSADTAYYLSSYAGVLIVGLIGCTPLVKTAAKKLYSYRLSGRVMNVLEPVFHVCLLVLVTAYLVDGSFSAFLYFRF
jgi:alginate O-acetyltransferase complex protein AlgI